MSSSGKDRQRAGGQAGCTHDDEERRGGRCEQRACVGEMRGADGKERNGVTSLPLHAMREQSEDDDDDDGDCEHVTHGAASARYRHSDTERSEAVNERVTGCVPIAAFSVSVCECQHKRPEAICFDLSLSHSPTSYI